MTSKTTDMKRAADTLKQYLCDIQSEDEQQTPLEYATEQLSMVYAYLLDTMQADLYLQWRIDHREDGAAEFTQAYEDSKRREHGKS